MNRKILLMRAISSEYIERKYKSTIKIICLVLFLILIGIIYLTSINVWWWLLILPLIVFVLLIIILRLLVKLVINKIRPHHTQSQRIKISLFVDKLEAITENLGTPVPLIFLILVEDIIIKNKNPYINKVITNSSTLHKDYAELLKSMPQDTGDGRSGTATHIIT